MFTADLKDLYQALAFIKRAADVRLRGMQPETRVLRFHNESTGTLAVTWFDYETEITVTVPSNGPDADFVADYESTLTAIKTLGSKYVASFAPVVPGGMVRIANVNGDAMLAMCTLGDLPALPEQTYADLLVDCTGAELWAAVSAVAAARGTDATLPMLTGVKLEADPEGIRIATTDRFRLATAAVPSTEYTAVADEDEAVELLVPGKQLVEFAKFSKANKRVEIRRGRPGGRVILSSDTVRISARLLECEFPRWRQLLPKPDTAIATITVDAAAVAKRLKEFALTARTVVLNITGTGVIASSWEPIGDSGRSSFTFPCELERVDSEIVTGFKPTYLSELLAAAGKGERATLRFYHPHSKPVSIEYGGVRSMLMPVWLPEPGVVPA